MLTVEIIGSVSSTAVSLSCRPMLQSATGRLA